MSDLRRQTTDALKWSYLSFFTNLALQPLFVAILARLLTPAEFGLAAIGSVLASFGAMLTELGVGQALVQRRDLTTEHIRAAFTSSVVLGVLVTAVAWVIAPAVGASLNNPAVVPVFRGFAATYVVASVAVVSFSLLRRELRFKPLMVSEVAAYVLGHGVLGLGAAYLGFGAMSLVVSAAATWVIQLAVTYAYARHSFAFTFRPAAYRDLYSFGARASLIRLLEFLSGNLDTYLIARFFDVTAVGLYNRASNLVTSSVTKLAGSLFRVLVPSFSALQHDLPKLRRAYMLGFSALCVVLFSLAGGIFACAHEIVMVLLGARFLGAVPLVQVFALLVPFTVLSTLSGGVAEATARLNVKIVMQAAHVALLAIGFTAVYRMGGGVVAFASVLLVAGVLRAIAMALIAARILKGGLKDLVLAYLSGVLCGAGVVAVLLVVTVPLRATHLPAIALLALELLLGGLMLAVAVLFGPSSELRAQGRRFLRPVLGRVGHWFRATV